MKKALKRVKTIIMSAVGMINIMASSMVYKTSFSHEEIIDIYRFSNFYFPTVTLAYACPQVLSRYIKVARHIGKAPLPVPKMAVGSAIYSSKFSSSSCGSPQMTESKIGDKVVV